MKMKKIIILILLLTFVGAGSLFAQFSHEVDFVSSYVWRGWDLFPKNKPAIQPSITYTFGKSGFSVNVWASLNLTDRAELKNLDEIDLTLNYDFAVSENINFSVGFINYGFLWTYDYTFKDACTQEFYAVVGFPKMFLGPTLTVYYDINLGDGMYVELAGAHRFKMSENAALELGAALGYNGGQWTDETGISDLTLSAALPFTIGKVGVTPGFNYTRVFIEDYYRPGDKKDKIWFSINFALD